MITKIRAKQLHEDVKGLVGEYGKDYFFSKGETVSSPDFWQGLSGSGFLVRERINIPSGSSGVHLDISYHNFGSEPFVNYSLISPSGDAPFYITQASVSSTTGIHLFFSDTVNQGGYKADVLYGTETNVLFVNMITPISEHPVVSDIENPTVKYEVYISGGAFIAVPI